MAGAAATPPPPFDVLLVDDSSRVARDLADTIRVMQLLTFHGVRLIDVSQGIDSANEQPAMKLRKAATLVRETATQTLTGLLGAPQP